MNTIFVPKIPKEFSCEKCNYRCSNKKDFNKHLTTLKHIKNYNGVTNIDKKSPKIPKFECDDCGNTYKFRQGLYKHKKKCGIVQDTQVTTVAKNEIIPDIDKDLLVKMLLKNSDMMEKMFLKNSDVMEKMLEVIPNIGNNNNNTNSHNTMNNQFNIQMFLNEHCKNAMNLTDFVQSLPITSATFDSTIENGLTKTITNMMLNGLSKLDILERPIHCTDASRKTLYVKEADVWEKDNELVHVVNSIIYLSVKQRTLLNVWRDANEGWRTNDRLQNKMTYLLMNTMELIERDDKEKSKIIRSISKKVYLDNETKKLYM